jgi:putative FmdB family regulatory protein
MPIYEYLCGDCGHKLDALQKLSDEPLVHCPHCAAPSLKRQMSAPSFRLKGGGWYETDFKNDKRRNIAESENKGDAKAEGKADKADAKADKPDSKPAEGKSGQERGQGREQVSRQAGCETRGGDRDRQARREEAGRRQGGRRCLRPSGDTWSRA